MNKTKHTPGPWHFTDQLESKGQSVYTVGYTDETGERTHDIRFIPPVSDWSTAHANAQLISAAPELLKLLKDCHNVLFQFPDYQEGNLCDDVKSAIAKAEGSAP